MRFICILFFENLWTRRSGEKGREREKGREGERLISRERGRGREAEETTVRRRVFCSVCERTKKRKVCSLAVSVITLSWFSCVICALLHVGSVLLGNFGSLPLSRCGRVVSCFFPVNRLYMASTPACGLRNPRRTPLSLSVSFFSFCQL